MRRTCGSLCLFLGAMIASAGEPPVSGDLDHSKLMVWRDADGKQHPVQSPQEWHRRRAAILAGMEQAMGPLPDRAQLPALDVKVDEEVAVPGFKRLKISLLAEGSDRVPALLYLPEPPSQRRTAAVLALHPTGPLGKGIITGLGKENRGYALELAERGYVVLAPDYPSFGDYPYDFKSDQYESGTMKGIFNHMRCVDLLVSRPEVDPERIGVIGHSLGGHNAMFVAAFDPRLKAIISSCGWTPFHEYYGGKIAGWTSDRYMPRLRDVYGLDPDRVPFDFYEVVAALAPRPFFSNSPLHDANFDVAGVRKAEATARVVYQLLGAADRLQVRYPDCQHDFPPDIRQEAYRFLDDALGHNPAK